MAGTTVSPVAVHISLTSEAATRADGTKSSGEDASDATKQIASGKKSENYATPEIAGKTRLVLSSEQNVQTREADTPKINLLTGRINLADSANKTLRGIASKFHARVTYAQQPAVIDAEFSDFCKGLLKQVEVTLNKKDFEGRSLFGGAATKSDAVDLSLATTPAVGATPDATYNAYFNGEDAKHKATVGGEVLEYGFSALDPGARDLIFWLKSGVATAPDGDITSSNGQRLQGMQDGLGKTTNLLSATQKTVGEQLSDLERIAENNEDERAYNEGAFSALTDADLLAQLTRRTQAMMMQQLMMSLQSSSTEEFKNLMNKI